jgi:hypothetical protein
MRYKSESLFSRYFFYSISEILTDGVEPLLNMIIKSLNRFIEYENILCWP